MRTPAFVRDPYLRSLDTTVASAESRGDRWDVVLADTVLYPEGGGQPSDAGTVAGVPVVGVRRERDCRDDGRIVHTLAGPLPDGVATVRVELDWSRRYQGKAARLDRVDEASALFARDRA